jgi:3-hydroxyacyl-CoA dehydrogenase
MLPLKCNLYRYTMGPFRLGDLVGLCTSRMQLTVSFESACFQPLRLERDILVFQSLLAFEWVNLCGRYLLVGHDVGVHVGQNFIDDFPDRVHNSRIIPSLLEAKRLGEKSGGGLYKLNPVA